jgi:hypothetical protein
VKSSAYSAPALLKVLQHAHVVERGMPVSYLIALLLVAEEEGLGINEYARRAGIRHFQMSRIMSKIGSRGRRAYKNMPEYGWIKSEPAPGNAKRLTLTPRGIKFLREISNYGGKASPQLSDTSANASLSTSRLNSANSTK